MSQDFHVKYRPPDIKHIWGQQHIVKPLRDLFRNPEEMPHAYLLTGMSGVGKTTLARIIAKQFNCVEKANLEQHDAAMKTGVDDIRKLLNSLRYGAVSRNKTKFIIVEECHMLSKSSWNSLLLSIEEPPAHVYFAFCTTEPNKVPKTIVTRCHTFNLKPLSKDDLFGLLTYIIEEEKLDSTFRDDMIEAVVSRADGSARQAIVYLSLCRGCKSREEVKKALETEVDDRDIREVGRLLTKRGSWNQALDVLERLEEFATPESIRIITLNYLLKVLKGTKSVKINDPQAEAEAGRILTIMSCFSEPFTQSTGSAELYLAVGTALLGE